MKFIDNFLNGVTMYKLVLYGLLILVSLSIIFGFIGLLPYSGLYFIYSVLVLGTVCYITNFLFAKIFNVQTNSESYLITAVILFFVLFPVSSLIDLRDVVIVVILAMASKYILAIHKKHIFNPAAISIFIIGLFGSSIVSWWVGGSVMLIPISILGFLILRKVQRFQLFFSFVAFSVLSVSVVAFVHGSNILETILQAFLSGPIIFLGTIMLTEPMTTPPDKKFQIIYGAIVGGVFGLQFQLGPLYSTPELGLILGNLFSYFVSPKVRSVMTLLEKNKLSADIYEFIWKPDRKISFKSGQYLEWTLGHKSPDIRGNRRFFTIASSPTEENLRLGVKFYDNSSSFKKKLLALEIGEKISASQLSGEFILPDDPKSKMVFIAGGIGVTPFRSMIKNILDKNDIKDMVLFFSNKTPNDIVYKDIFDLAEKKVGLKTIYVVNALSGVQPYPNIRVGLIDAEMIKKEVPDYKERQFYISGPHGMVTAFENTLVGMGVRHSQIKIDFFPGYV